MSASFVRAYVVSACAVALALAGSLAMAASPGGASQVRAAPAAARGSIDARLAALEPARPLDYLALAEDVADRAAEGEAGASDRALAQRLARLAGALDVGRAGRSAALFLAYVSESEDERRRFQSLAEVLGGRGAAAQPVGDPGAGTALLQAFAAYRRGDATEARRAIGRSGAAELLDAHPAILQGGAARFRADCDAMRSGIPPVFSRSQSEALHALAGSVLGGRPRSWSEALVHTGPAPLPEIDLRDGKSLFGVDPAACLWRGGAWTTISGPG
jgi:hypothetical protein